MASIFIYCWSSSCPWRSRQPELLCLLQKETKENAGSVAGTKISATTPSGSAASSALSSPRLTLSPRLPSIGAANLSRRSSNSNQRLGSGLLRQLDVSKSLQAETTAGAASSEPTSPDGSVSSESASVASESAHVRKRAGKISMCAVSILPPMIVRSAVVSLLGTMVLLVLQGLISLAHHRAASGASGPLQAATAEQGLQLAPADAPWTPPC